MISSTPTAATSRNRLALLAPIAVILVGYAVFFAIPMQRNLGVMNSRLDTARLTATTLADADSARNHLQQTQDSVQKLNKQLDDDRHAMKTIGQTIRSPDARLETAQLVTEILQQFNLSIVNQTFDSDVAFSLYLTELIERINNLNVDSPLEFWEIEMSGSYSDVTRFLGEVRGSGMRTFPIQLEMSAAVNGEHRWVIVFVI